MSHCNEVKTIKKNMQLAPVLFSILLFLSTRSSWETECNFSEDDWCHFVHFKLCFIFYVCGFKPRDTHVFLVVWDLTIQLSCHSLSPKNEPSDQITPADCKRCRLDCSVSLIWAYSFIWVKKEMRQLNFGLQLIWQSKTATTVWFVKHSIWK